MRVLSGIVVVAFCAYLLGLTVVIAAKPSLAERFLRSFASSARAHYIEQAVRLIVGAAIVACSPSMWQSRLFELFGWVIVLTTVGLLLVPWRWHHRFGQWAIPLAIRYLKLFALGAFALGALILYAVLQPHWPR